MKPELKRLSVRSVDVTAVERLDELKERTRLPIALLVEDGIDLLWEQYGLEEDGEESDID